MTHPDNYPTATIERISNRGARNPHRHRPGAYILVHNPTGLFYVGSTADLGKRWIEHQYQLKSKTHINPRIEACYTSLSDYSFRYHPTDSLVEARQMEKEWLQYYATDPQCTNYSGRPPSAAVRQKLSAVHKGIKKSPEHAAAIARYYRTHGLKPELMAQLKARTGERNPNAKAVIVDGVRYPTGSAAARALNLKRSVFQRRLEAVEWPTYHYE